LDLNIAKQSIPFIAQVLGANCEVVKVIADANRPADYLEDIEDPYADFWRFTLFSYHSGVSCFEKAIKATPKSVPLDWENLSQNIDCVGGANYVDGVWGKLLSFENYLYTAAGQEIAQVEPIFAATPTPFPTRIPSTAQIFVQVFLDGNQNGIAEESEWLNDVTVLLQGENDTEITGTTVNGQVTLGLADFPIGSEVTVSLPGLYRGETITVPAQGILPVVIIFDQPILPTVIP
jgi:hypothetical protein